MQQLARWIRAQRLFHFLTQEQLADKMRVEPRTIRRWEGEESVPQYESLERLCLIFNVTTDELWFILSLPPEENDSPELPEVFALIRRWRELYQESQHFYPIRRQQEPSK